MLFAPVRDDATVLKGPLGGVNSTNKSFATFGVPIAQVKAAGLRHGATLNEVAVAVVGGGIRRFLLEKGDPLMQEAEAKGTGFPKQTAACLVGLAVSPQQLMHRSKAKTQINLQNKVAIIELPLPLQKSWEERVAIVVKASARLKNSLVPQMVGCVIPAMLKLIGARGVIKMMLNPEEAPKGTCVLTNVPGPQRQLLLAGAKVQDIAFWNNPADNLFTCGMFSYNGQLNTSLIWHPELCDGSALLKCIQEEWAELLGTAPVRWL